MSRSRITAVTATATWLVGPGVVALLLTLIGWAVAIALGDGLIGAGAALIAFIVAAPVLGPVLGAINGRTRA